MRSGGVRLGNGGMGRRRAGRHAPGGQPAKCQLVDDRQPLRPLAPGSPQHLLYLPWNPKAQTTDIDTFRRQILVPVLQTIQNRHLAEQIDYVVYSSDFPSGISLDGDIRKVMESLPRSPQAVAPASGGKEPAAPDKAAPPKPEWPKILTGVGSLTGLTYLWQQAASGPPNYFDLQSNRYMRLPIAEQNGGASLGFRGNRRYDRKGEPTTAKGRCYFLSTMLGVTAGRGNTLEEILQYLKRSAGGRWDSAEEDDLFGP